MKREDIDIMWNQALQQSVKDGEQFTRYHFHALARNAALDEIAAKIEAMPFGDTAASFAVWIKEQKT
jgi:hypothetical protein